ncbi:hypothetical protein HDU97_006428 [Phlyctochytrium planicorne]|nr:hypothetical protein HDU97_006428 [Phlyctochytrium planicorne]
MPHIDIPVMVAISHTPPTITQQLLAPVFFFLSILAKVTFYSLCIVGLVAIAMLLQPAFQPPLSIAPAKTEQQQEADRIGANQSDSKTTSAVSKDKALEGDAGGVSSKSSSTPSKPSSATSTSSSTPTTSSTSTSNSTKNTAGAVTTVKAAPDASVFAPETFPDQPKTFQKYISDTVSLAAVRAAVMLKQSPIPDKLAGLTHATLVGYNRIDNAFNIQERLVSLGETAVRSGMVASGIAASAFLRAGVAYHMTPGYKPDGTPDDSVACGGGECKKCKDLQSSGDGKGSPVVKIVRTDIIPGGMPLPELVEASTQTDHEICGQIVSNSTNPFGNGEENAEQDQKKLGKKSSTLFQSVVNTSATVASVLLTSSSNYVFGAETTRKLMGADEEEDSVKKVVELEDDEKSPIRNLNVGGIYYATTLETLRRVPGSRLAKWFPVDASKATLKGNGVMMKDGCLFLDRDGTYFRHILNHLRGLPLSKSLQTRDAIVSLRFEAVYYDLVGLVVEIDERLAELDQEEAEERHRKLMEHQHAAVGSFRPASPNSQHRASPTPSCCSDTCSISSDDSSSTARVPSSISFGEYMGAAPSSGGISIGGKKRRSSRESLGGEADTISSASTLIVGGMGIAPGQFLPSPKRHPPSAYASKPPLSPKPFAGAYPPSPAPSGSPGKTFSTTSTIFANGSLGRKAGRNRSKSGGSVSSVTSVKSEGGWEGLKESVLGMVGVQKGGLSSKYLVTRKGWDLKEVAWVGLRVSIVVVVVAYFVMG